ncbi:hypothetical protein ACJRO7_027560 [Eucalyptus globulus]|uniref:Alpha/beta hydrolase fold-3 domain-containing protein n=1 Tax=Eucalyptus globulus TaxID=34317 RepID=A0ABD3K476_EUCGL
METEVLYDLSPFARIFNDCPVERLWGTDTVPPSLDKKTRVQSKDRQSVFLQKLPVLVYYHGGCFIFETAWSLTCRNYLNDLVVVAVSIEYRRAPPDPLPAAYDDSGLPSSGWPLTPHSHGNGPRNSAGANIVHNMGIRLGEIKLNGIKIAGIMMSFYEMFWQAANPTTTGCDLLINPMQDMRLSGLDWNKVLVCVAGKNVLKYIGRYYKEALSQSVCSGVVEGMETPGEDHVFHLLNPGCDDAVKLMKKLVSFMNEDT